jgi:ACR3 family arsenite efflux pump ArsB
VSIDGRGEMASKARRERPEGGFLGFFRAAALIAMLAGAAGSIVLLFHASQRRPPLLMIIFVIWVLSPYVALIFANALSGRWSVPTRALLYGVMLVVAPCSLAIYGDDALRPRRAQAAFVYVVVPRASLLLIALVVPTAVLISGGLSRRSGGT